MATYSITIADTGVTYRCPETKTVLEGMECMGRRGIPVGCRGGGCGVCKIEIVSGQFSAEVMSAEHVCPADLEQHRVLACRVRPSSDLVVRIIGSLKKRVSKEVAA